VSSARTTSAPVPVTTRIDSCRPDGGSAEGPAVTAGQANRLKDPRPTVEAGRAWPTSGLFVDPVKGAA
jgi:hypothetical protein